MHPKRKESDRIMKAKVVEQEMSDSVLDWTHGFIYKGRRLLVDEHQLVITADRNKVHAFFGDIGDHDLIGEVDIPTELFSDAMIHASTGERLKRMIPEIVALTGEPSKMPARFEVEDEITSSDMDNNEHTIFESSGESK